MVPAHANMSESLHGDYQFGRGGLFQADRFVGRTYACLPSIHPMPMLRENVAMMTTTRPLPISHRPAVLLLATGGLLGTVFALGKIATQSGVAPLAYALAMHLGAGAMLAGVAIKREGGLPFSGRHLRFYTLSGLVSMALPNAILFIVIPRLGAGLASVVYALPALLTLVIATLLRVGLPPNRLRSAGIGLGALGTLLILGPRGGLPSPDLWSWMLLALAIPVSVAVGNVYRTMDWPDGASPLALAAGMLLGAAAWIALGLVATGSLAGLATLTGAPFVVAAQIAVSAVTFVLYFRLQSVAGPVYLSQIGYVMTATGLLSGMLLFGESYPLLIWLAVALIAAGVVLTTRAQRRDRVATPDQRSGHGNAWNPE